ncbi:putative NADPH dehydrogenase Afvap [[Candida] railenensis]|uniref:NADPH dehydrogenase Afvap n=1 Tax=[Candida] railenensis TaxID=45579 RepID=A0A9P0QP82_9ASCO|nr:putative NADPH dehydrogenase Afvap [[Candida] railenensis]
MSLHEPVSAAEGVPFWTPKQILRAGTAVVPQPDGKAIPKIFQPLKIRGLTIQNRIGLSPMCQYSANPKFEATPWHVVHYGEIIKRGPGLSFIEATSVSPEGGLSPQDLAIFNDEQAKKLKDIVDFAHSQNQHIGIQIAHGGRKASGSPMYEHLERIADASVGGWPDKVVAPSPIPYRPGGSLATPKELTIPDIKRIIKEFGAAAKRAVEISGFDIIQIHAAHGYLINEFYSKVSNKRTDEYGGSFENRVRFLLEIIDEVRANIPEDFPLSLRISAIDNSPDNPESWKIEDSVKLAPLVIARGVDIIDTSSGGNDSSANARGPRDGVHVELARAVKKAIGDSGLVSCVGSLRTATYANKFLEEGVFDIAEFGRPFLQNPALVNQFADELGVRIENARQLEWSLHTDRNQMIEAIAEAKRKVEALKL